MLPLFFFLSHSARLERGTSSCSAVPTKPTSSLTLSLQWQHSDVPPASPVGTSHSPCGSSRTLSIPEYLLGNCVFGTSHPAGASLGSLRCWLTVMYALRKYAMVGNEPCVAGVENSLPQTSLMCYFWFTTGVRRALSSLSHVLLDRHKTKTRSLF